MDREDRFAGFMLCPYLVASEGGNKAQRPVTWSLFRMRISDSCSLLVWHPTSGESKNCFMYQTRCGIHTSTSNDSK